MDAELPCIYVVAQHVAVSLPTGFVGLLRLGLLNLEPSTKLLKKRKPSVVTIAYMPFKVVPSKVVGNTLFHQPRLLNTKEMANENRLNPY